MSSENIGPTYRPLAQNQATHFEAGGDTGARSSVSGLLRLVADFIEEHELSDSEIDDLVFGTQAEIVDGMVAPEYVVTLYHEAREVVAPKELGLRG